MNITVNKTELQALRDALNNALITIDALTRPKETRAVKKITQKEKIENYKELLSSGAKYKKPKHLQKK